MVARKFILPAVGVVALAGGAVAFYHFNGSSDALDPQAMAKVIPDEAFAAAFISTDQKTWSQLEQFGTPQARTAVRQNLQTAQKQLLAGSNLDYDKDLKPWVGNVMVAALPAAEGASSTTPSPLIVVGIRSKKDALDFANKLKNESKVKSVESDYKGIKIASYPDQKSSAYTAVLKDFLVVSPDKQAVEHAIDTFKGEPSLASKPNAKAFLTQEIEVKNPIARFYIPDYAGAMQELMKSNPKAEQLSPGVLDQLKRIQSIAAGVGIDQDGLRLKAVTNLDAQFAKMEYKPAAGSIVAQFPSDTFALISGAGINRYWTQAVEQANAVSEAQLMVGMMRQNAKFLGLDLDRDVFGWMDGEFAIGLLPSSEGLLAQTGFGGVMVIDTSDRKAAEAMFSKLDGLVKTYSLQVADRSVQGKTVTEWQVPQGALLGHGWLDQDSAFIAFGGPVADAIAAQPNPALNSSDTFKAVTGSLPKQNLGYFYLDMEKTMALMKQTVLVSEKNSMPPEAAAMLDSIRGIGITASQPNKATSQVELLLSLKPAQ